MENSTEDGHWYRTHHRPRELSHADIRDLDASEAMFAEAERRFAAGLRRARLARQVRIQGMTGVENTITKVRLLCLVPNVDRVAVAKVFGELQIDWYAKLPSGSIREVDGSDAESSSWLEKDVQTPYDHVRRLRGLHTN